MFATQSGQYGTLTSSATRKRRCDTALGKSRTPESAQGACKFNVCSTDGSRENLEPPRSPRTQSENTSFCRLCALRVLCGSLRPCSIGGKLPGLLMYGSLAALDEGLIHRTPLIQPYPARREAEPRKAHREQPTTDHLFSHPVCFKTHPLLKRPPGAPIQGFKMPPVMNPRARIRSAAGSAPSCGTLHAVGRFETEPQASTCSSRSRTPVRDKNTGLGFR